MKDLGIYYKRGCGGYFILFYILASGEKFNITKNGILMNGDMAHLDNLFYSNFTVKENLRFWKSTEQTPDSNYIDSPHPKLYFKLNSINEEKINCFKINPYISDTKKWYLMQWRKHTWSANEIFYKKNSLSHKIKIYKSLVNLKNNISMIDFCDYKFDFLDFLNNRSSREKLCNLLNIRENRRQQEYLEHYINCHDYKLKKIILY